MIIAINGRDLIGWILDETIEIENHMHNNEKWIGASAVEDSLTGYQCISGNGAFGSEVLLLDTANTPIESGKLYFDLHRIMPIAVSNATLYLLRIVWGTGTFAAAVSARQYTTVPCIGTGVGANISASASNVICKRIASGTKVWAQVKNATNLATINFIIGLHEYTK
jgi:hypothetical protein